MPDTKEPQAFYDAYDVWYKSEAGINALFYHLLGVDTKGFSPYQEAPNTDAKEAMILASKSDLSAWIREVFDHPDEHLVVGGVRMQSDLVSAKQLLQLFDPEQRTRVTKNGMSRELKRSGAVFVNGSKPVATKTDGHQRLVAVRNFSRWKKAGHAELVEHFDKHRIRKGTDKC